MIDLVDDPAFEGVQSFTLEHWIPPPAYCTLQRECDQAKERLLRLQAKHMDVLADLDSVKVRNQQLEAQLSAQAGIPSPVLPATQMETPLPTLDSMLAAAMSREMNGQLPPLPIDDPLENEAAVAALVAEIENTFGGASVDGPVALTDADVPSAPASPIEEGEVKDDAETVLHTASEVVIDPPFERLPVCSLPDL